ncbi:DMT family transporter [Sulfitobacter pseudonitzschiae]|uniref:DMT family transporter n=2 Tax=Pseudosulfitobacter pseudonitzschiae TaxID=1402135 RepID=A0A9Q2P4Z0_9RHOB|nr:DMT family transporter [Pseudosulfitobacter pseudonitzschiae]MBM2298814.1 DMT family transporter [Pseudosulfitobacter pseudonitzschiae]MBM2303728.1 DMT family transporter [Pseudosulfitobacter pseudonitzschiae]MBM2313511.1 DMT family transporter [Pseudosulfitobacter pseudonitzschiae]MBM2318425.1 DMT family transporter [Pseudosulfitobacter pseudonitzschiae]
MIGAMAAFAVEDSFVKAAALTLPVGQILILFGLGGALCFALSARASGAALFPRAALLRVMQIRSLFEITGRLFYVLAIALTPLSSATVILQATPLLVVAGAALVFGEQVGWRRWSAIVIGLIGVIVIVQPGSDAFSALSIFAIIGMIGFAGRDLASRAAPKSLGTAILGFYGFLALIVAGMAFSLWEAKPFLWPTPVASLWLVGAILAGVGAYAMLMRAMRVGDVSAVTPFRYTRLLFGIGLGVFVFGETPTTATFVGAGLIVVSGAFIMWRGKRITAP